MILKVAIWSMHDLSCQKPACCSNALFILYKITLLSWPILPETVKSLIPPKFSQVRFPLGPLSQGILLSGTLPFQVFVITF